MFTKQHSVLKRSKYKTCFFPELEKKNPAKNGKRRHIVKTKYSKNKVTIRQLTQDRQRNDKENVQIHWNQMLAYFACSLIFFFGMCAH